MKVKRYDVFIAGGTQTATIFATCITNACKLFIATLKDDAAYKLTGKQYASIRYKKNYSICGDFVVQEAIGQ
ncbi:MAG: hypothetical protein Q4D42_12365 [Eubacteriales bacterium]|nr:hypothetical protein [Eubacteriales bacterium]